MTQDPQAAAAQAVSRNKRDGYDLEAGGILTRLDESRVFKASMLVLPAAVAGLLLAPQLATPSYPSGENLRGTVASANIKAPYDLDVADEETTEHLRDEAETQVRRVFDFDVQLGDKRAQAVAAAFSAMRSHIDEFWAARSEEERAGHPQEHKLADDKLKAELRAAMATAQPEAEKILGTSLSETQAAALLAAGYDAELAQMMGRAIRDALALPVVADRATVESDREKGISVQRVPDTGGPITTLADVDGITDISALRRDFPMRVKRLFPEALPQMRELVANVAGRLLEANLTFNRAATELAREVARLSVKTVKIAVKKGEMVIRDGERFSRRHVLILDALRDSSASTSIVLVALGAACVVLLLVAAGLWASRGGSRQRPLSSRDMLLLASLLVATLAAARLWLVIVSAVHDRFDTWPKEIFLFVMPLAAGAMIVRLVLRADLAVGFAVLSSVVVGLMTEGERLFPLYALLGCTLAASLLGTIAARSDLLRAGVWVGLGQAAAALALQLFSGETDAFVYLTTLPAALVGGILAGLATVALTPVLETVFGYTTDLKLLELANLNHPALKELIVQAPGSYHHSVIVGSLVEAAAEAIGANPLLARVMAYYHDLGKGCNPGYFIENQRAGQNPHDKLKPSMSAMIIRRHVTDGLDIARRYHLGGPILAGIAEHHGTTLIHYFHHKAKEQAEAEGATVAESDYRYPGRKPQSREAALVMLGDSIEAASRSLGDPTPARLQGLVNRIINLKFTDGQLDECDLTLKDLHTIARAFSRVLNSIYHHRPEYPELLKDITGTGKRQNGDSDPKPAKKAAKASDDVDTEPRPDNLRRLGLS